MQLLIKTIGGQNMTQKQLKLNAKLLYQAQNQIQDNLQLTPEQITKIWRIVFTPDELAQLWQSCLADLSLGCDDEIYNAIYNLKQ